MNKPLSAVALVLLGALVFLCWHLTSTVSDLQTQVTDLEGAVTELQLRRTGAPDGAMGMGAEAERPPGISGKAGKAGKGKKGGKSKSGQDRQGQLRELVTVYAAEVSLDPDITAALDNAVTTLSSAIKATRGDGGGQGDPTTLREQRQAHFGDFEATVRDLLDTEQAEDLLGRVKESRGGAGPPR